MKATETDWDAGDLNRELFDQKSLLQCHQRTMYIFFTYFNSNMYVTEIVYNINHLSNSKSKHKFISLFINITTAQRKVPW